MEWYPRYADAALVGMRPLNDEQYRAYNVILDLLYSRDGSVPDNERFMCSHLDWDPRKWRRVRGELLALGKIKLEGNFLINCRATSVITSAKDRINVGRKLRQIQLEKQRANAGVAAGKATGKGISKEKEDHHLKGGGGPLSQEAPLPSAQEGKANGSASARATAHHEGAHARSPPSQPETLAEKRKRVQQELGEMTDDEVAEWCKQARGPNGAHHGQKL
jgi:hypothetical protein